jgi:hypothetical protein
MSYTQAERKEIADNIREYLKQEKKEEFYMMARGNEEPCKTRRLSNLVRPRQIRERR